MDVIFYKSKVEGSIRISGTKNEALPILSACLLTSGTVILKNMPDIEDIYEKIDLMINMGAKIILANSCEYKINTQNISNVCKKTRIRTGLLFLGPLLARYKEAKVAFPEGDKIGTRNINYHIDFLEKMGAKITLDDHYIIAKCEKLQGITYKFNTISVGATQHLLLTSVLAEGETTIINASIEPETVNLCRFLVDLGYKIDGVGTSLLRIYGNKMSDKDIVFQISSDRIQIITYLIMTLITNGEIEMSGYNLINGCAIVLPILTKFGLEITLYDDKLYAKGKLKQCDYYEIITGEYPGFSTDYQSLFAPLLCIAAKKSIIKDLIYPNRYYYVDGLNQLGANIIRYNGYIQLFSSSFDNTDQYIEINDIRAGASLLIAAITTQKTILRNFYHINRGYSNIFSQLKALNINYEIIMEK